MKAAHSKTASVPDISKLRGEASKSSKTIELKNDGVKAAAQKQFDKIREALEEVRKIEAGVIKPKSLDELLDEL